MAWSIQPNMALLLQQPGVRADVHKDGHGADYGRALWRPETQVVAFRVLPSKGSELLPAPGDAQQLGRRLPAGELVQLVLGHGTHMDRVGSRWVPVAVPADSEAGESQRLDGPREALATTASSAPPVTWWARWSDLELLPKDRGLSRGANSAVGYGLNPSSTRLFQQMLVMKLGERFGALRKEYRVQVGRCRELRESAMSVRGRARIGEDGPSEPPSPGASPRSEEWARLPTVRASAPGSVLGRVSVVCPTYARRHRFHESLYRCFCGQEWPDKELIVLDTGGEPSPFFTGACTESRCLGGHGGGGVEVLAPSRDPRVLYVHVPSYPLTLGHKRNQLLELASGEIVAHFDDDNFYTPQYLPTMVAQLRESRAQLVELGATFAWDGPTGPVRWYDEVRGRAESFVHLRGPLTAMKFAEVPCGEEQNLLKSCVVHAVDDAFGIFLHVNHGGNISPRGLFSKVDNVGGTLGLEDIPNEQLRDLVRRHSPCFR